MFRNGLEPWHLLVLVALFVALFGYKRLPDAARSLGRSLRIFKTEMKGMGEDDKQRAAEAESAPPAVDQPAPKADDVPQPSNQDTGKAAS